jgi:hypothetical protein
MPNGGSGILGFKLIHAPTNSDIVDLVNGMVVDPIAFGVSPQFNIRADVDATVQSVLFSSNGRAESMHPYAYCGDPAGKYNVCPDLVPGATVMITVRGHTGKFLTGTALPEVKVSFSIKAAGGPLPMPQPQPQPVAVPTPTTFNPVRINCGGIDYVSLYAICRACFHFASSFPFISWCADRYARSTVGGGSILYWRFDICEHFR